MQIETQEFIRKGLAQIAFSKSIQERLIQLGFSSPSDLVLFAKYSWMTLEELLGVHWAELSPLMKLFLDNGIHLQFPYCKSPKLDLLEECQELFMANQIDFFMGDSELTKLMVPHHVTTIGDYREFVKSKPADYTRLKQYAPRTIIRFNMWLHEFGYDIDEDNWRNL